MTTITFSHGPTNGRVLVTNKVELIHLKSGDTVFAGTEHDMKAYRLYDIKSIIPPKGEEIPTKLQSDLMTALGTTYRYDKQHSIAAAGVVLKRVSDGDFWFFGVEGEIMHNPEAFLVIKL